MLDRRNQVVVFDLVIGLVDIGPHLNKIPLRRHLISWDCGGLSKIRWFACYHDKTIWPLRHPGLENFLYGDHGQLQKTSALYRFVTGGKGTTKNVVRHSCCTMTSLRGPRHSVLFKTRRSPYKGMGCPQQFGPHIKQDSDEIRAPLVIMSILWFEISSSMTHSHHLV